MKNILICSYRDWALEINHNLITEFENKNISFITCKTNEEFNNYLEKSTEINAILFIGWSDIIPKEITDSYLCVCLHPSLLPKYRGGSPIQHQMISGENTSGISIFKMNEGLDKGPIYFQKEFKLKDKDINQVFESIIEIGSEGFIKLIDEIITDKPLKFIEQNEKDATYFKRRTPEDSEIQIEDFDNFTAEELSNKINSLLDPYPNAFIVCKDGSKLFIKGSKYKN